MPALIPCPNTNCQHRGPCGFNDPSPWGTHFYHSCGDDWCPGAWLYNENWYDAEVDAWKAYKQDNPTLEKEWVAAFDARIIEGDFENYEELIEVWRLLHV